MGSRIVVIGGGIAGFSAAAALAENHDVTLIEAEDAAGYHATGRSAAYFSATYGNATVRELTRIAEPFFRDPPRGFTDARLITPRSWLVLAGQMQGDALSAMADALPSMDRLAAADVETLVPILRPGYALGGLIERSGGDIDVDALLQGFVRRLRRLGGKSIFGNTVTAVARTGGVWRIGTSGDLTIEAEIIVNAAGAWADQIASLAAVVPLGVTPLRRTAVLIDPSAGFDPAGLPVVVDVEEQFYFKPEAGKILVSPADETPDNPGDTQADEHDVAVAVDRFETATNMTVRRVSHRWAGLRSFAPDRAPICGFDRDQPGFFWLAGQGGYGVQTAPALAGLTAALISGGEDGSFAPRLIAALSPTRFGAPDAAA